MARDIIITTDIMAFLLMGQVLPDLSHAVSSIWDRLSDIALNQNDLPRRKFRSARSILSLAARRLAEVAPRGILIQIKAPGGALAFL
jgi:hypothetical protein